MNCDLLINKILYFFSRIPIQYSFDRMKPKLKYIATYSRFYDYLDSWTVQTLQMEQTRVLYTNMEAGIQRIPEKCSYLKE